MQASTARPAASAVVVLLGVVGALLSGGGATSWLALGVVVAAAAVLSRPLRGWPLLALQSATVVVFAVVCNASSADVGWFGTSALAGWAVWSEPLRRALVVPAVATATYAVCAVINPDPGWFAWTAGTALTAFGFFSVRRQVELVQALEEAQAGLADRARDEERARIAHELHDVIGHALTVSLLHITSARLALAEDPVEAEATLAEAERLSQQSLAEVRAVVGLMRDPGAVVPLPGSAELDGLVEGFRRAGTAVDWSVDGDPSALTATEGLTVYRIVQEALTNVVRHAPGAAVTARLVVADEGTTVVVDSDGAAAADPAEGAGLVGMRARAEALGGRLTAGPVPTGWRVEAVLP